jgi:hypothetical protein
MTFDIVIASEAKQSRNFTEQKGWIASLRSQ